MMNVLFFAPTTPPNNRQQTFFSLRAISAAVEPLRSLLGTILVCETYPMGGTESKREEDPGGDTEVSSPDIKLEDAEPQQNRFSNRGKRKQIRHNKKKSVLSTAISSVPMTLLQIACRNFEIPNFHSSDYFINVLVNTHPSKTSVLDLYAKLKEYNKYQTCLDENVDGKKNLGKALILAAKYEETFGEPIGEHKISASDSINAFHVILHYLVYLLDNIPKGINLEKLLDPDDNSFENISFPTYTLEQAKTYVKHFDIIFSLIQAKAREGNLDPDYQGAFSGNKSPLEILKLYESESGIGPSQEIMNNRVAKRAAENMRMQLGISHFDVEYGDTASIFHYLGKRNVYNIIRSSEKDILKRTPYAFLCGLLLLQNYPVKYTIRIMCTSLGDKNPEKNIEWDKLVVHFIAAAMFSHCIALGEIVEAIGYAEDFPQLPQEVCNWAKREAIISKDEILVFTSSESESEEDDDEASIAPRSRGLSQGMNQSQLYMNMNGGKSNTNNNKASNHWAKMRKRVSQAKAFANTKGISEMTASEKIKDGIFSIAVKKAHHVGLKKVRKIKTEMRWQKLRTMSSIVVKDPKKEKLKGWFTAVVDQTLKRKHIFDERKRRQTHQLYIKLKDHHRYIPLDHAMDGIVHIEPLCRALSLITLWLYEYGYISSIDKSSQSFNNKESKNITLKMILHFMSHKNIPSANLETKTHSFAVHLAHFAQDARINAHLSLSKALPIITDTSAESIWTATKNDNVQIIERVLRSGVDVDARESNAGRTCLHLAALCGNTSLVFWLLTNGASVRKASALGMNALHYACKYGHADVVALLLDWDIDVSRKRGMEVEYVNSVNVSTLATPLHFATHSNSSECVKALLLRFADATLKDNDGRTCLDLATAYGHEGIVALLKADKKKRYVDKVEDAKKAGIQYLRSRFAEAQKRHQKPTRLKKSKERIQAKSANKCKESDMIKYMFNNIQKYTIQQYRQKGPSQRMEDPPLFSVLTYKALAYTACHMAVLSSLMSNEKEGKHVFHYVLAPTDDEIFSN